jgi:hypothetical protein
MQIDHIIDGKHVIFTRNWFTGRAYLSIDGLGITLQSQWNLGTHFSVRLRRAWVCHVGERILLIEKQRPMLFAGIRPQIYRLFVDGELSAERRGY